MPQPRHGLEDRVADLRVGPGRSLINTLPGFDAPRGLEKAPTKEAARAKINTDVIDEPSLRYEDISELKVRSKQKQAETAVVLQDQIEQTKAQRAAMTEAELRAAEEDKGLVGRLERQDPIALAQRRHKDRITVPPRPHRNSVLARELQRQVEVETTRKERDRHPARCVQSVVLGLILWSMVEVVVVVVAVVVVTQC